MNKKADIMKIWAECFPTDSARWRRMFFDAAYTDDEALTLTPEGCETPASSLLLLSYSIKFRQQLLGLAYVYGAATRRRFRARGYMSELMRTALHEASDRGDTFIALIPARKSLQKYYARFGFAPAFYSEPRRFTAIHRFEHTSAYVDLTPESAGLYEAFNAMMMARECCVQHTRSQFLTLMDDARLSGHIFAAVGSPADGTPLAMAWARPEAASSTLCVRELLACDTDAANAVLDAVQRQSPGSPLTVMAPAPDDVIGANLVCGGMARVVNAESALAAVAADCPSAQLTIRLTDPLLPENSGFYTLNRGSLTIEAQSSRRADLELSPEVLTAMLFSGAPIAEITGLPAVRPRMSLMLD